MQDYIALPLYHALRKENNFAFDLFTLLLRLAFRGSNLKTMLPNTITQLNNTITHLNNTITQLNNTIAKQNNIITQLKNIITPQLNCPRVSLASTSHVLQNMHLHFTTRRLNTLWQ